MDEGRKSAPSSHEEWADKRVKQAAESCAALSQCPWRFGGAQSISCGTPKPKEGTGCPLDHPFAPAAQGRERSLLSNPWPEHAVPCLVLPSLLVER